ncbi:MAG TPA: A/G-specific adenine glycosylase [Longimicrobiales bacterium]
MAVTRKGITKSKRTARRKVDAAAVRAALLAWYDTHHRTLPWREDTDAYRVWVSEIMLQQTRVETVIPYYQRWLAKYPTIEALAAADLQAVLKQWEGLGYYSRARNLHKAAGLVHERYQGRLPAEPSELRALPGIGDYTAGAVASIAYNRPAAAVDGNVRRVLSRLYDVAAPTASAIRDCAVQLLDRDRPGDFNQALMELGATVCSSRAPLCKDCPLRAACCACANGTVSMRPGSKTKAPIPHERVHTLVRLHAARVLLARRPDRGLLAGLWEFPEVAVAPARAKFLGDITHVFSHKRITYVVHRVNGYCRPQPGQQWVALDKLHAYALPKAQRKIEKLLQIS